MHRADTDECCLDSKVWTTKEMENIKLWEDGARAMADLRTGEKL